MAPEHETRERALYDHESDEPRRRRRPAADWGVGEDIFDRMPSRRFGRSDRRAEHREIVLRRGEEAGAEVTVTQRPFASWLDADERPLVPGESRTIVFGAAEEPVAAPKERKPFVISGPPDRLPVPRTQRPP